MNLGYNIFKYAAKEISHSAFWAWVLECTTSEDPAHKAPRDLGLAFLKKIGCDNFGKVKEVCTEHCPKGLKIPGRKARFDIHVAFDSGKALVIENKVTAPMNKNQLKDYHEYGKTNDAQFVFLNLGYWYNYKVPSDWERLSAEDVRDIFDATDFKSHPLLNDYYNWLNARINDWAKIRHQLWNPNIDPEELSELLFYPIGQWQFIKKIFSDCTGQATRGVNSSGVSFTEYDFFLLPNDHPLKKSFPEYLTYRIDTMVAPYLQIKQYLHFRKMAKQKWLDMTEEELKKRQSVNYEILKGIWDEAVIEVSNHNPDFNLRVSPSTGNGPYSKVLQWFYIGIDSKEDSKLNAPLDLKKWIPRLHKTFIQKLKQHGWPIEEGQLPHSKQGS
ncbi:MAG TPA: hypothetical protein ENO22_07335 [candidate division Zixibacteria bacterium]|nr:hypothetical protein [candidate division Zixibacteria bacterium]